jgi:hypothetical protein
MPQPLHLVACVAGKLDRPAPAAELYSSDWFKKARAYVEAIGAPWRILSAEHGLVHPEDVIEPYNTTLGGLEHDWQRLAWGDRVCTGLWDLVPAGGEIVFLAGQLYRDAITAQPCASARRWRWSTPMQGLGIGEQKAWLAREARAAIDAAAKPRSRAGVRAAMEARDVLHRAPAQAGLDLGGFGTRTQPTLF